MACQRLTWACWSLLLPALAPGGGPAPQFRHAVRLHVDGALDQRAAAQFRRHWSAARDAGADLAIVEIDGAGGAAAAAFEIVELLRQADSLRTVAYVPRQALGAAALAALGCDELVLAPRAAFGDLSALTLDSGADLRAANDAAVAGLAARLRGLAATRGQAPALLEAFADRQRQVFMTTRPEGGVWFVSDRELAKRPLPAGVAKEWLPETGGGRFAAFDGRRAAEIGLAAFVADSCPEALERLGGAARETEILATWVDGLADALNHPVCATLLLATGLVCLYLEFAVAGMGLMWLPAGLCFTLFFWSKILGGAAGWLALALFVLGVACLALEIFVIPGFGVVGLTGILLTGAGLVIAVQGFAAPTSAADWPRVGYALAQLAAAGVLALAGAGVATQNLERLPLFRHLVLAPKPEPAPEGEWAMFQGQTGIAATDLRPAGKVRVGTRLLDVVAEGFFVPAQTAVEVVAIAGNRVVVRPV